MNGRIIEVKDEGKRIMQGKSRHLRAIEFEGHVSLIDKTLKPHARARLRNVTRLLNA
ncbi:unnamed protein product [Sphenostylis stenocarpa]|uniref:Uncharacterized protein n=1 Tax=Sphenostylis stenocarpa TaxID=92480 RepID=A0AA86TBQ9_9FABA|nr:unnamed protein product [Sphenostylis stenocarpa]